MIARCLNAGGYQSGTNNESTPQSSSNGKGCGWGKLKIQRGRGYCLSGHLESERQQASHGNMSDSLSWLDGSFSKRLGSICGHFASKLCGKLRGKAGSVLTICNLANKYLRNLRAKQL